MENKQLNPTSRRRIIKMGIKVRKNVIKMSKTHKKILQNDLP